MIPMTRKLACNPRETDWSKIVGAKGLGWVDKNLHRPQMFYPPVFQDMIKLTMNFLRTPALFFLALMLGGGPEGGAGLWADAPVVPTLTAVEGVKVGHDTLAGRPTGCTVILVEEGAVAGVDVMGSAPGTRETDLLDPVNLVQKVHAIVLSGGSAFGLDSASGVVRYLEEKGIGYPTNAGAVPIVPAAILYDLGVGDASIRPDAESGYRAALAATADPVREGSVGAGAGATVGKLGRPVTPMKSGVGSYGVVLEDGLVVAALVAVNAVGDVIDPETNAVIAGMRSADGKSLVDVRRLIRSGFQVSGHAGENTTLGVVATNAVLTKVQATKIAQMAHDGLARTIYPAHTPFDGDTLFALGTGHHDKEVNLLVLGALAAEVTAESVLRAVRNAEGLPGLPSASDLKNDQE